MYSRNMQSPKTIIILFNNLEFILIYNIIRVIYIYIYTIISESRIKLIKEIDLNKETILLKPSRLNLERYLGLTPPPTKAQLLLSPSTRVGFVVKHRLSTLIDSP